MLLQAAHARKFAVIGLLALAFAAAPAFAQIAPSPADVSQPTLPLLIPKGNDLASKRLRNILYADRWNRARSLYELGDYQAAASYYMALVNEPLTEKILYDVRFRLAECLYHVGAFPGAVKYFKMVRSDPQGKYAALASARLTELNAKLGTIDEARKQFRAADRAGIDRSRAAYSLGHVLASNSVTEAVHYFGLVEPETRYYAESQFHLGALAAAGENGYASALTHFANSRSALPTKFNDGPRADPKERERAERLNELISLSTARVHTDALQFHEALAEYSKIPATGKYRDVALLESAWVLLKLDQVLPALENVQTLLRERPNSERVLEAALLVGYLTIEQGKFNAAYGHFEDTRQLLEGLDARLQAYAAEHTAPEAFYSGLIEAERPVTLPAQVAIWVQQGNSVRGSNTLLDEVREVEQEMRDLYRQLDQVEVMAAGPRGGPHDPAGLDNLIRLELSNSLYRLQQKILELRFRPFVRHATQKERDILRLIRRIRADIMLIRTTPSDVNAASADRQVVLSQLSKYLLQIHPEIGLDTAKRAEEARIAEVEVPLGADDFLRKAQANLAELSREVTLDDRWYDAALEYTIYLEDRLQGATFRRLRVTERYQFVRLTSVLFRQSAELQRTLRDLGNTLADIQESIFLEMKARAVSERKVLASYQQAAGDINKVGLRVRGLLAQQEYGRVVTAVSDTAVRADLGALDTGWRVKELEDIKVRELLGEKQDRLRKLNAYYANIVSTSVGPGPYQDVENLSPERLAQSAGSVDSPYGRELLSLGREVVELAKELQLARSQQEQLSEGVEPAILTSDELAVELQRRSDKSTGEGRRIQLERPRQPTGTKNLPVKPTGKRP